MRIVVQEEIPEDLELRQAWNRLALGLDRPEVFYTYEWAISVQRAYRESLTPLLFLAYDDEQSLVGLVALARRGSGEIAFLVADTGDYCDFLSAPELRDEFVQAVFAELHRREYSKIVLTNLPADSRSAESIRKFAKDSHYHLHVRTAYHCARLQLGSGEERDALKKAVTGKKRLRRNLREMDKIGTVGLHHATEWEQIEGILPGFERTHIARFLENGKISSLVRGERRLFVRELARELSESGWVALSRLLISDEAAAWHFGFRFAGSWFWYQPTMNREFGDFSPGYCLLAKIIEQACDSADINVVDLGLGAEGYKERFTTEMRETLYCEMNALATAHVKTVVRNQVARAVEKVPKLETWIRGIRGHANEFRERTRSAGWKRAAAWALRGASQRLGAPENVLFFTWPENSPDPVFRDATSAGARDHRLVALDTNLLAEVAMRYEDDPETLRYLMDCAQRLAQGASEGYLLVNVAEKPVQILWVKKFEGSEAESKLHLGAASPEAALIFDYFTPRAARGQGYLSSAIDLVARDLRSRGRSPWICVAESDAASLREIEKSGFQYQFGMGARRIAFLSRNRDSVLKQSTVESDTSVPAA